MSSQQLHLDFEEFKLHFDAIYLGGIPRLLDEDGMFLSFLVILTATEALAGVYSPQRPAGERFKMFVERFFPNGLRNRSTELWQARNLMVHAFNPGPFGLVSRQSRLHLTDCGGVTMLNAEDLYATLVNSSREYFEALLADPDLQTNFAKRLAASDGGGPQTLTAYEYANHGGTVA